MVSCEQLKDGDEDEDEDEDEAEDAKDAMPGR